jgi:hypothetical protein
MEVAGNLLGNKKFKRRPRYTMVLHQVREKFELSLTTYTIVDSIHKLSSSDPNYRWCVMSKADLGDFLKVHERTVFRSITEAEEKALIERGEHGGLRATEKWIRAVEIYSTKG